MRVVIASFDGRGSFKRKQEDSVWVCVEVAAEDGGKLAIQRLPQHPVLVQCKVIGRSIENHFYAG
eukprot:5299560-Lingulodinium_polyedra.AAC.1